MLNLVVVSNVPVNLNTQWGEGGYRIMKNTVILPFWDTAMEFSVHLFRSFWCMRGLIKACNFHTASTLLTMYVMPLLLSLSESFDPAGTWEILAVSLKQFIYILIIFRLLFEKSKGQLISKFLFGVFNSSKKRTKTIQPEVLSILFY